MQVSVPLMYVCCLLLPFSAPTPCFCPTTGPWPAACQALPADYVCLAEDCWARQSMARPSAEQVLQRLLAMLAEVGAGEGQ
jgi:hypothetical protein